MGVLVIPGLSDFHREMPPEVQATKDILSSGYGLSLFVRFWATAVFSQAESVFKGLCKSRKGQSVEKIFKQLQCFFMDGSSRHLSCFDDVKQDGGYARVIESGLG